MVENRTGRKLKTVRSDNGTEYAEGAFKEFYNQEGIVRHWTVSDTPQQNEVAERLNALYLKKDVTFDERSMVALSKATVPQNGDVKTVNTHVMEIESRSQPDSILVHLENHDINQNEDDDYGVIQNEGDEPDHKEIQQENAHTLQQRQDESLNHWRPLDQREIIK
ncbi:hypothetical protein LIER_20835 [Lithospermum erythrorhizon]|uniref:Integrase catalytic domain-containing protein n=1 Tax=Lithospermum erythrorhizon TaxID=34254 RepID=A0AAV3QNW1_LITER